MLRLINDLSAKKDLELCQLNIKPVNKTVKKKLTTVAVDEKKPKMNIMAYFKLKYKEDPTFIYDIINEQEINDLFKKNEAELKTKKKANLESAKASLIYKELISKNKSNQTRLRTKKEQEEDAEFPHQEEIVECDVIVEEDIDEERANNLYEGTDDEDIDED
jgi:hypothetical protein